MKNLTHERDINKRINYLYNKNLLDASIIIIGDI